MKFLTAALHSWVLVSPYYTVQANSDFARALPNSPNGYVPSYIDCPGSSPSIRTGSTLSPNETAWLQKRRPVAVASMRDFLVRISIPNFDAGAYVDKYTTANNLSALPNVGIALSGGGWRALTVGAGVLEAFDSRSPNSTASGHLGGLLQSATYVAGLSGGSWLVSSIYDNNFTTVNALDSTSSSLWQFGRSILQGPTALNTVEYWDGIVHDVTAKAQAGFNISITDLWGRALSYQLINATAGGAAYTFSSISLTQGFQDATQPFPIVVADSRSPGQQIVSFNSTVYEFNPFEMGSWDANVFGFMPTRFLGTNMTGGMVTTGAQCVIGFDNCGFVLGTSSSLFNEFLLQSGNTQSQLPQIVKDIIIDILTGISHDDGDIANYSPNPFYGWNNATNPSAQSEQLTLVDGGEDLQVIPFYPLIQPVRNVDVIFAVDSSDDTPYSWPNGSAIMSTFERSRSTLANGTGFPYIPDPNTMINLGLNNRPTFFGCNSSNVTGSGTVPLIVYIPNSPYVAYSNLSTFQLATNNSQRDAVILNGYNMATMGNGTVESTWPTCVACAIISRSLERTNTTVPAACSACFTKFCWNGTLNATTPGAYAPTPILKQVKLTNGSDSMSLTTTKRLAILVLLVLQSLR